ncbi:MAG TPA: hypothetical protein VGG48_03375 [Rhizomicrobium sp.]|jgi:hypothetical protein
MSDDVPNGISGDRVEAARLHAAAREAEAGEDYWGAKKLYEQSLRLHEDAVVRAEFLSLLSAIGPQ